MSASGFHSPLLPPAISGDGAGFGGQAKKVTVIRRAAWVWGRDASGAPSRLQDVTVRIVGNRIVAVGPDVSIVDADIVIDGADKVVLPGLVNTHHHLFQAVLRTWPALQNQPIDRWIARVCGVASQLDDEAIYSAALANLGELLLYGCTLSSDMHYLFPAHATNWLSATVSAADALGIRFDAFRGSLSRKSADGGTFPDDVVQPIDVILRDIARLVDLHHDPRPDARVRIGAAPCTLFSNTLDEYREVAALAHAKGILLQTHLAESAFEVEDCIARFGKRPLAVLEERGWVGPNVSFVHGITLEDAEIDRLAQAGTAISHCPISNARQSLGEWGVAPIPRMLEKGVTVGVGVDGAAGNDSSNLLEELRWARTVQGIPATSTYLAIPTVLEMGTLGGARLLGRASELGSIEVGKLADIAIFDLSPRLELAGAFWDPIGSLLSCQARRAHSVLVDGEVVVQDGRLVRVDESEVVRNLLRVGARLGAPAAIVGGRT